MKRQSRPQMFQHILCPVDFSAHSREALRYAAAMARRGGGQLTVLFVSDPLLTTAAAAAGYDAARLTADSQRELERFVQKTLGPQQTAASLRVGVGHPGHEIAKAARRFGSDLVVMGTHGLRGASKLFFGSTTESVLRHARIPVLAVPAQRRARRGPVPESWPGPTVLAPIDLDEQAARHVRTAERVASWFEARPLFLHVLAPPRLPEWFAMSGTRARQRVTLATRRLRAVMAGTKRRHQSRLLHGDPPAEIVSAASATDAGLIVLTLDRRRRPVGPHQGSITYQVLCTGSTPVLAMW